MFKCFSCLHDTEFLLKENRSRSNYSLWIFKEFLALFHENLRKKIHTVNIFDEWHRLTTFCLHRSLFSFLSRCCIMHYFAYLGFVIGNSSWALVFCWRRQIIQSLKKFRSSTILFHAEIIVHFNLFVLTTIISVFHRTYFATVFNNQTFTVWKPHPSNWQLLRLFRYWSSILVKRQIWVHSTI